MFRAELLVKITMFAVIAGAASYGCTHVDTRGPVRSSVGDGAGAISGRISPDASIRIIAKLAGTSHEIKENVKGEVTLTDGGVFTIEGLPPAKYDLLFFVQGASSEMYIASRWSEVVVEAGTITSGINYRLTPQGSTHLIDEIIVVFDNIMSRIEALEILRTMRCTVKDRPGRLPEKTWYLVDIPDDKSVGEMIELFQTQKGVVSASPNHIGSFDV
jgi:hypothetical protein